jgi:hypothetical protein
VDELHLSYRVIHTAEPLEPDPSPLEVEIAVAKLMGYKSEEHS